MIFANSVQLSVKNAPPNVQCLRISIAQNAQQNARPVQVRAKPWPRNSFLSKQNPPPGNNPQRWAFFCYTTTHGRQPLQLSGPACQSENGHRPFRIFRVFSRMPHGFMEIRTRASGALPASPREESYSLPPLPNCLYT